MGPRVMRLSPGHEEGDYLASFQDQVIGNLSDLN